MTGSPVRPSEGTHDGAAWAAFSVLRILVAPLLGLAFLLCGVLSPFRFARAACLAAAVTEAAVSAYGGFTWFVPLFFERPWMHPH